MGKAPLNLDWNTLLPKHSTDPTPELEIVKKDQQREEQREGVEELSDQQLSERIHRIEKTPKNVLLNLKDRGAKLSASLKRLKEERERRRKLQRRSEDVIELRKPTQSQSSSVSDASHDMPQRAQSQSVFAARLSHRLEDASDKSTSKAFEEELQCFGQGNHKSLSIGRLSINKERRGTRMSSREVPFQSVSTLSSGKVDCGTSSGNCKGIASSRYSPSPPEENLPARFSEKPSPVPRARDSRKRKVLNVVDLDEEDAQPIQPIVQIDGEGWVKDAKIYYPSRIHPEAVELCGSDLDCLNPGSHLSSPIINFYIQYLQRPISATGKLRGDYHFFNTYFYKKLEEAVSCKRKDKDTYYVKFRRWWKGIEIFQKAYIFLPIHADNHWSLAIICIPAKEDELGPILLHLDSLRYHNSAAIFENIESFLREEWNYLKQAGPPADVPIVDRIWKNLSRRISREVIPVPQQKNDSDCGLFVLYFMERFVEEAPERLTKKDLHKFGKQWFQPEDASGLRERVKQLLREQFELARLEDGGVKSPSTVIDSDEQCSDS